MYKFNKIDIRNDTLNKNRVYRCIGTECIRISMFSV